MVEGAAAEDLAVDQDRATIFRFGRCRDVVVLQLEVGHQGSVFRHGKRVVQISAHSFAIQGPIGEVVTRSRRGGDGAAFAVVVGASFAYRTTIGRVGRDRNGEDGIGGDGDFLAPKGIASGTHPNGIIGFRIEIRDRAWMLGNLHRNVGNRCLGRGQIPEDDRPRLRSAIFIPIQNHMVGTHFGGRQILGLHAIAQRTHFKVQLVLLQSGRTASTRCVCRVVVVAIIALVEGLCPVGFESLEVRHVIVSTRIVIHHDDHVVQAVKNERFIKVDDRPVASNEVHGTAEDEVVRSHRNPVGSVFEPILVGTHHIDVDGAVAWVVGDFEEADALNHASFTQFLLCVDLLGQRILVIVVQR